MREEANDECGAATAMSMRRQSKLARQSRPGDKDWRKVPTEARASSQAEVPERVSGQ